MIQSCWWCGATEDIMEYDDKVWTCSRGDCATKYDREVRAQNDAEFGDRVEALRDEFYR